MLRAGWARRTRQTVAVLAVVAGSISGAAPSAWAATQRPVDTRPMADPGIYLYKHTFNAFTTGGFGLWRSTAPKAEGPWTPRVNVLKRSSVPNWVKKKGGIWAPDVIQLPGGGWVAYFAAVLNVNPSLHESEKPAQNAHCIGAATASAIKGPYTMMAKPVVCLEGYGAGDDMIKDPGKRQRGQGVIGADPVIINNSWDNGANELFLLYKTQSPTGQGTIRMVRLNPSNGFSVLGVSHQLVAAVPTGPNGTYQFKDTVEAPSLMVLKNGWFILFTAHGAFDKCTYSTQWYASRHPWSWPGGPTTLLSQAKTGLCAPGTGDISPAEVPGQYRFLFNGYPNGNPHSTRALYADGVSLGANGHTPTVHPLAPAS
jgi:glycosyl hydrolase family 43